MKNNDQTKQKTIIFLILTFALTIFISSILVTSGGMEGRDGMVFLIMWSPGVSAIITCLIFQKNLHGLGWKLGKLKYILISYCIPLLVALVTYSIIWITGLGKFQMVKQYEFGNMTCGVVGIKNPPFVVALPVMLTLGLFLRLLFALGEEIGWRGFLVPNFAKIFSLKKAAIISGVIWFLYHIPGLFFLEYYSVSRLKSAIFFMILAVSASVIMFWIRIKSGSLWTAAIFHASHNLAIQGIFNEFTIDTGNTHFFSGEFGIGIGLVYAILAVWFWRRMGRLQS